jgi:hypothetical protein
MRMQYQRFELAMPGTSQQFSRLAEAGSSSN